MSNCNGCNQNNNFPVNLPSFGGSDQYNYGARTQLGGLGGAGSAGGYGSALGQSLNNAGTNYSNPAGFGGARSFFK